MKVASPDSAYTWLRLSLCLALLICAFELTTRSTLLRSITIIELVLAGMFFIQPVPAIKRYTAFLATTFGCVAWVMLSSLWSANSQALQISLIYLAGWATMATLLAVRLNQPKTLRWWLYGYGTLLACLTLYYMGRLMLGSAERFQLGYVLPNASATLYFPILFVGLDKLRRGLPKKSDWPFMLIWIICIVGFCLTFSRGALMSLAVGLAVYAWVIWHKAFRRQRLVVAGFVITVVMLSVTWARLTPQFSSRNLLRPSHYNLSDRQEYSAIALRLFKQKPLVGQGIGSYAVLAPLSQSGHVQSISVNAHSSLLQSLAELGIVGLVPLVATGYLLWKSARLNIAKPQSAALLAGLLAMAFHFAIDIQLEYPLLILALFSQMALVMSLDT